MGTDNAQHAPTPQNLTIRRNPFQPFSRKRFMRAILALSASLVCVALFSLWQLDFPSRLQAETNWFGHNVSTGAYDQLQLAADPLAPSGSVNGLPTTSFRDNLRNDTKYITSWGSGGWSNDVISIINLIYLGLITDRVPVIPVFLPSQLMLGTLTTEHTPLPFGDIFDLPYLREAVQKPILEWSDVKATDSTVLDDLGCWNVWESIQTFDKAPRGSFAPWKLKLDISYTKTPAWIKMIPDFEHDRYSTFWSLASLAFPSTRKANLVPPLPSPKHNVSLPPDEHMLCYDFLYYVAAHQGEEIGLDYSPAWRYVGQHMRWTARLERLGDEYLRRTLGVKEDDPIPPFVAVHVRHNDFEDWCEPGVTLEECFAPLPVIARRVQEVQAEILERKGINTTHVIVTSDETSHTWWRGLDELGWVAPDHSRTKEFYGHWYTILVDAVIQSKSLGFVGTARSTVSVLSNKRVESWQDGSIRTVKWGKPGADDH